LRVISIIKSGRGKKGGGGVSSFKGKSRRGATVRLFHWWGGAFRVHVGGDLKK